jgi:hypothetical protein
MPTQALRAFEADVAEGRTTYRQAIARLPQGFREIAVRHFEDRVRRAAPRPLLGEYAPWLAADILGITDRPAVQRVVTGWLHLYFFTMLLDDLIDRPPDSAAPREMITSALLLQRGLSQLLGNSELNASTPASVDSAFAETAEAALHELTAHRQRITSFTAPEIQNVGQKIALLRVCVDSIAGLAPGKVSRKRWLAGIFEGLANGIQLLDDLTDLKEDYAAGSMTLPLTLAAERDPHGFLVVSDTVRDLTDQHLLILIRCGSLEDTLLAAGRSLRGTLEQLKRDAHAAQCRTAVYVQSLESACLTATQELKVARTRLKLLRDDSFIKPSDLIARQSAITKDALRALEVVAQGS